MASMEIAIRHTVRFGMCGKVEVPLSVPLPENTLDPRYVACTNHRTACDCREAEHAETRAEFRAEMRHIKRAFDEVLAGHATWVDADDQELAERLQCKCTGCQIARRTHMAYAAAVAIAGPPRTPALFVAPDRLTDESEIPF